MMRSRAWVRTHTVPRRRAWGGGLSLLFTHVCLAAFFLAGRLSAQLVEDRVTADVEPSDTRLSWEIPQFRDPPLGRLGCPLLERHGITMFGWIEAGIGANNWGSPFNGPVSFNDRNWQGQLNQFYLVAERLADLDDGGWAWGGRVDLLLGTDYLFTTARGLDAWPLQRYGRENVASWAFSKDYGLAMPQLYADLARADWNFRLGHFYALGGYESVPAIANFFYSHAFTYQNEPFTFTGMEGSWQVREQLKFYAGIHTGWNNFTDGMPVAPPYAIRNRSYPGAGSAAAFFGGVELENADGTQTLAICTTSGNEITPVGAPPDTGSLVGNRSLISTVYTNRLTERLTYVFQNDNGWQFNAGVPAGNTGQPVGLAQWYSFNQYVFWKFSSRWQGGLRVEYFRDNNGYIVTAPLRNYAQAGNPGYYASGFAGNFWECTLGLNYQPNRNWVIRPELRYDWFAPNAGVTARPFGRGLGEEIGTSGTRLTQFRAGCDVIFRF